MTEKSIKRLSLLSAYLTTIAKTLESQRDYKDLKFETYESFRIWLDWYADDVTKDKEYIKATKIAYEMIKPAKKKSEK